MISATQRLLAELGEAGCYFLSVLKGAGRSLGRDFDIVKTFEACVEYGIVHYNENELEDPKNCQINDSSRLIKHLLGPSWKYRWEPPGYVAKPGEIIVQEWRRQRKTTEQQHFTLPDWDPLGQSLTRLEGRLVSNRVFWEDDNAKTQTVYANRPR